MPVDLMLLQHAQLGVLNFRHYLKDVFVEDDYPVQLVVVRPRFPGPPPRPCRPCRRAPPLVPPLAGPSLPRSLSLPLPLPSPLAAIPLPLSLPLPLTALCCAVLRLPGSPLTPH